MNTASALELVRKIAFLEERLGKAVRYEILEPFALDQHDLVQIQVAAKRIADFVQLKDLVFVVGIVTQQQGTLGNVEVAPGQDAVFIEIAPETMEFDGAVCGVLAHEISHSWLKHNLRRSEDFTNLIEEHFRFFQDFPEFFHHLGILGLIHPGAEFYFKYLVNTYSFFLVSMQEIIHFTKCAAGLEYIIIDHFLVGFNFLGNSDFTIPIEERYTSHFP